MILLNTSFHIHSSIKTEFLRWIREKYIPSATSAGGLTAPLLSRILVETEPGAESYALQMQASDMEAAKEWYDGEGDGLRAALTSRFGQNVLFFTTYMEIIAL